METETESPGLAEMWERIRAEWGDEIFHPEPEAKPARPPHTCPALMGEFSFGPWYWRTARAIPWYAIVESDRLGKSARHVRANVLVRVTYDAYRCTTARPARISLRDSGMVAIREPDFGGILRDLNGAGLVYLESHPGRKFRAAPVNTKTRHEIGRWKTCRNLWWPALSHVAVHLPAVSFVAYLFMAMHTTAKTNRATVARTLPGWTRTRRDFQRGVAALVDSGIVVPERFHEYTLPVLFGPNEAVNISPGWVTLPEPMEP